jgi:hypothetical protein
MNACRLATIIIIVVTVSAPAVQAQQAGGGRGKGGKIAAFATAGDGFKITESAPIEVAPVKNAPFAAQAVTEFTQTLGDGNRIERLYQSSVARDSRGRTRREEEIALVGPLAAGGGAPRLVTIIDPDSGVNYTLDEERRVAYRSLSALDSAIATLGVLAQQLKRKDANVVSGGGGRGSAAAAGDNPVVQDLGFRTIEGLRAQGTRTTTTIAAGAIGNLQPIEIVSERWFSPELQMPVLVTRRDPRNGDTTYRLTNVVRAEQPDALFTVPSGYEITDGSMKFKLAEKAPGKARKVSLKP